MIFITGATGFLGSYLAKALIRQGEKVRALKRSISTFDLLGNFAKEIEWVEGDLLDVTSLEAALTGIEKIYHCAGVFSPSPAQQGKAVSINAEGTANLFNMALDTGVRRVLHVSSTIAMGMPPPNKAIDENYYAPTNKLLFDYFKGKRYAELEAWRANAEGMEVVIVNPGGILGAGYWDHEPMSAFSAVYNGLSFYTGGSNGFVDVRDAVAIMIQLMDSAINGERYILISENVLLRDFLNMIADELKVKHPLYKASNFITELAWRYEGVRSAIMKKKPDFTKDEMRIAQISFPYSNEKIVQATGYKFRTVAESIHDTAQLFLASKNKGVNYAVFDN